MAKKNKVRRYRMNPTTARQLGLEPNNSNRYRLNKKQEAKYLNLDLQPVKRLFFDIEMSRMEFNLKDWNVKWDRKLSYDDVVKESEIICISYKWENEDKIHTLDWGDNMSDKELLKQFIPILESADQAIGHNGDRYDIKKIRTRAIYHRLPMAAKLRTLDTLKKSKSGFSFPNNRLDTIAKFLGVGAKIDHEGIKMWDKVENGDKKALKEMIEYCEMDVQVLEDVYTVMESYITQNLHAGTLNGGRKCDCPSCGSEDVEYTKLIVTSLGTPKRLFTCKTCLHKYETSNAAFRKFLGI